LDAGIKASHVNLIDADGVFHRDVAINEALRMYDRIQYHLVMVSPGVVDEFGVSDANNPPVCKIISKMELRAQHQKKLDIERRKSKGIGSGPSPKSLELNWAIAPGDLKHRLSKLQQFLTEGRKVEVLLGPKRRGRTATDKECNEVLNSVRDAVDEIKGAGEAKEPEGKIGGVMTLVFEGRKIEEKKK
jgi:translation initiation factor IF-3